MRPAPAVLAAMALRVVVLRNDRGWTAPALAIRAGLTPRAVNIIEEGKREPMASSLLAIARALGTTVEYLWSGEDRPRPVRNPLEELKLAQDRAAMALGYTLIREWPLIRQQTQWVVTPPRDVPTDHPAVLAQIRPFIRDIRHEILRAWDTITARRLEADRLRARRAPAR